MGNAAGKKIPVVSMSDKKESIDSINGAIRKYQSFFEIWKMKCCVLLIISRLDSNGVPRVK